MRLANRSYVIIIYLISVFAGFSQSCDFFMEGIISDNSTNKVLPFAEVYVQETKQGTVTDDKGKYRLSKLCKGTYHLVIRHLNCAEQILLIDVTKNLKLDATLEHSESVLGHVIVKSKKGETLQEQLTVNKKKIEDNISKNLGDLTEKFTGVSSFKNGSGISKPIIHGLYGNRVAILNNGIPLAGQHWGIDHAPEIDAQAAQKISVIKGVAAIKYPAAQLGGVVLVESTEIDKEPHLHGRANAFVETNGIATGASLQLQQYKSLIGWKLTTTTKNSGDRKAPSYYLRNTGSQQQNITLQLASELSESWKADANISYFHTKIGVLAGAQAGTREDLTAATEREIPNLTQSRLSFGIGAPMQDVDHYSGKFKLDFLSNANTSFTGVFSAQQNLRKEFDVRRGGRTALPVLDLTQKSYQAEGVWKQKWKHDWNTEAGLQRVFLDNTNKDVAKRDIRSLVPDYIQVKTGFYATLKSTKANALNSEFGFRISRDQQNVVIFRPEDVTARRFNNSFLNYSGAFSINYERPITTYSLNLGFVNRSPEINERFSDGIHLTEATILQGDPNLKNEQAAKVTFSVDTFIKERFSINILGYFQQFKDYIYLEPIGFRRIGLIAPYPLSEYQQTNKAIFTGADITLGYEFTDSWSANFKGSYLYAQDITRDQPVIFAPANNMQLGTTYNFVKPVSFLGRQWENLSLTLNQKYEFKQKRFPFIENFPTYPDPPPGFYLMDASVSAELPFGESRLRLVLKGENLLNNAYRNYMNRLRFYADEEGFNLNLTAILTF